MHWAVGLSLKTTSVAKIVKYITSALEVHCSLTPGAGKYIYYYLYIRTPCICATTRLVYLVVYMVPRPVSVTRINCVPTYLYYNIDTYPRGWRLLKLPRRVLSRFAQINYLEPPLHRICSRCTYKYLLYPCAL